MQKLLSLANSPILTALSFAAFLTLAYGSKPYGNDRGYSPQAVRQLNELARQSALSVTANGHKHDMSPTEQRQALLTLYGE